MVTTDSAELAATLRSHRSHGEQPGEKWVYGSVGLNFRITDLQAAVGLAQLGRIHDFIRRRQAIMALYRQELAEFLAFQEVIPSTTVHPYMMGLARAPQRDALVANLRAQGIECRSIRPIHHQPSYQGRFAKQSLPQSDAWAETGVCLPLFNRMTDDQAGRVIQAVKEFYSRKGMHCRRTVA
jgi:dTDP-4-amino-4,6-dideoxygalactose transaminase